MPRHKLLPGLLGWAVVLLPHCKSTDDALTRFGPAPAAAAEPYGTQVHQVPSLRGLQGSLRDPMGRPTELPCASCHATMNPPPTLPESAQKLGAPHEGLVFAHGGNTCRACHDERRYDALHLADGQSLPMTDAMRLCAQCHGSQASDSPKACTEA